MEFLSVKQSHPGVISNVVLATLNAGGIVIVPTDTVYGIIGRADREETVAKIFAVKNRPQEKALPVFVKDIAEARKLAYISDAKAGFLEHIWPGPVTVVFAHKDKLPPLLTGGLDTIGMRIPDSNFLLDILARTDFPLAQTSANISSKPSAKNREDIEEYFAASENKPDLFIDGGEMRGQQSSVIDFSGNEPKLLRQGAMSLEKLASIVDFLKRA